jgi:hypothetical protein
LPNKDIFYNKEESEIVVITYKEEALKTYRSTKTVKVPFQVLKSYSYSSRKLGIGTYKVRNDPNLVFESNEIAMKRNLFTLRIEEDKFGNECVKFSFDNSDSYFTFFYNKYINNTERVSYEVSSKEELFVFLEKLVEFIGEKKVRYCDCFVSAYDPVHQRIFLDAGFEPYGYIPAYKYNKTDNTLEDQVVFVYYRDEVNLGRLKVIPETKQLIKILKPAWNLPE